MKNVFLIFSIFFSFTINAQSILLECGQNSGQNFNGWYISPHQLFDAIEFDEQSVSFYSEYGGNFPIILTRKVEGMKSYKELSILFNFDCINNCELENVVYYTSEDGRKWTVLEDSRNNFAVHIKNDSLKIKFVRVTANVFFFENGKIECNYAKIEGFQKEESVLTTQPILISPFDESFFIFSFEHELKIETAVEKPYEIFITSITGQIVYREQIEGSRIIELPAGYSGVFIVSIIYDNAFQASKKIIL